jgi:glycosyltransferase involved in cell wall biosynthesis
VVPCFNEAARLDLEAFRSFAAANEWAHFLFVDDGSQDDTGHRLEALARAPHGRFALLTLPENRGKAEAVRAGMLQALEEAPPLVGFWDADLATPLSEMARLRARLVRDPKLEIVMGSRVQLLGYRVRRRASRHYLGRIAATLVAFTLRLPVYDTQCGAKLFRVTPAVREAFREPFLTRWEFDVEILARWLRVQRGREEGSVRGIQEVPVREWHDVEGSRIRPRDFIRAPLELARLYVRYRA